MSSPKVESTAKLDFLRSIEQKAQQKWAKEKPYEADAPSDVSSAHCSPPKFFITFPYPYMNGLLHLGHGFSLSKAEFAARYWRLKGRRVLWPFGLHCTGTPIAACAQKLANEMKRFGNPPNFPENFMQQYAATPKEEVVGQHKGKRGKVAAAKPQWVIMKGMGLVDSQIAGFADPNFWLHYFPPRALHAIKNFGCHVDYRRSFITTSVNPYYNSMIQWQFKQLRAKGYLNFGKRYAIYSPLDAQPCADHDRATGEGVLPQEYCVVKLIVQNPLEQEGLRPFAQHIGGMDVVFPGATLRSETVVGQTNCWISPSINYSAFNVTASDGKVQIFLMTHRAARNMAYQGISVNGRCNEEPVPIFTVSGAVLVGIPLYACYSPYPTIYALPMMTIVETKGTGVVMSVPSDSPDDWINLHQLQAKPEYRKKLGLKDEWVVPFPVVPIISIPGDLGTDSARIAIEEQKVQGPKDTEKLEAAKKQVYQAGFYQGEMIRGPFMGEKVSKAKVLMQKMMLERGEAIPYYEPTGQVESRSGDECVVALCDQWYIEYGKEEWKQLVLKHLDSMNFYSPSIRNGFEETLNWLSDWPCSRTFGLGTSLPWEDAKMYIVDSLSDSTIYMAYYTVAHFFHTATDGSLNLDGTLPNYYGLTPSMVTDDTWNYILKGLGTPEELCSKTGIPIDVVKKMRNEFLYWYPVDLRVSAKDLIPNHLTMFLYNHAAIWDDDPSKWPRGIFCNGHILVDGEKMSKSAGNFITLDDALCLYGVDACRLAIADAGDSLDDANFVRESAKGFILKLANMLEWAKDRLSKLAECRTGEYTLFDRVFDNAVNSLIERSDQLYERAAFRSALNIIFFESFQDETAWSLACGSQGLHRALVVRFLEVICLLLCPLAPHAMEHLWTEILGKEGLAVNQKMPELTAPVSMPMQIASKIISDVTADIRVQSQKAKKRKGMGNLSAAHVYIARSFHDWQLRGLEALHKVYRDSKNQFPKDTIKIIQSSKEPWLSSRNTEEILAFIAFTRNNVERFGPDAMSLTPLIDDMAILQEALPYITLQSGMRNVVLHYADDESIPEHSVARSKARLGQPTVAFTVETSQ